MLGRSKPKPVAEHEARGEIERVYHEIRQVLRVTGVNLNFRTWAGYETFLPAMWDAVRPNAETRAFEDAADRVRAEAAGAAETLGRLNAAAEAGLGESQTFHVRTALDLYHYINPKLLVLTAAVRFALAGETIGKDGNAAAETELIDRGPPAGMYPMAMEAEDPDDDRLKELFADIRQTLALPSVNSDYRTLALWPDYLSAAWDRLKPIVQRREHQQAADQLRETARSLARDLPRPLELTRDRVEELGEDAEAVVETTERFEQLLPGLILNVALLEHDWRSGSDLSQSPFPAAARHVIASRGGA